MVFKRFLGSVLAAIAVIAGAVPAFAGVRSYTAKRLGLEYGLSSNYIESITQDKRGFVWVATEDGLNMFDGSGFIPVYKNETDKTAEHLSGNELNALFDDPVDSVLWIGTQRAGLNAYNYSTGRFIHYRHDDSDPHSLATDDVTDIAATAGGDLLIATFWAGVDRRDRRTGQFIHYNAGTVDGLPDDHVWTVADGGNDDVIYVGHDSQGLSVVSTQSRKAWNYRHDADNAESLPGNSVTALLCDNGVVFVGTDKGLAVFDSSTGTFKQIKLGGSDVRVFDIQMFGSNELWVATEFNGIFIVDLSDGYSNAVVSKPIISDSNNDNQAFELSTVRSLDKDSFGNIWVGAWGVGVNFLSTVPPLFSHYDCSATGASSHVISNRTASCVATDRMGRVWVGTDGGGLNRFVNDRLNAVYNTKSGHLPSNYLHAARCDSDGNMWFGMFDGGLVIYDVTSGGFSRIPLDGEFSADVRSFYERGDTMFVSASKGVYLIDIPSRRQIGRIDRRLARALTVDRAGNLWIGTFGSGLKVYDSDMNQTGQFTVADGFPSNTINDVYFDSGGSLWVATAEGLVCFPSLPATDYVVYNSRDGLPNSHTGAIVEDFAGNIWVSTNNGIACVSDGRVSGFTNHDNIPLGSFMRGSGDIDSDGTVSFGSINGLYRFKPEVLLADYESPRAVVTDFRYYDEYARTLVPDQLKTMSEYNLRPDQNSFTVTVNIGNYAFANRVEYAYRLVGFDQDWFSNGSNSVTYRNVPPGSYTLEVCTRMLNQDWSDEVTSVAINIQSPMWLTWWAKLLYTLVAVGLVAFIITAYSRSVRAESLYHLERQNRVQVQKLTDERLRFYTNITHELRTPLTLIIGPLEDALKGDALTSADRHKLSIVSRNAHNLLNLVNQILEFRKTESHHKRLCVRRQNIASTVYEVVLKYKELLPDSKKVKIVVDIEPEEIVMPYDKDVVMIIMDNLISNALKYTVKGRIRISCNLVDDNTGRACVQLRVSDTGYGIGADSLPMIFDRYYQEQGPHQASGTGIGLSLVKNLVELHHGTITVDSKVNEGSTFTVLLPVNEDYPEALQPDEETSDETYDNYGDRTLDIAVARTEAGERPMVLIVEDNSDLRDYISESFTDLYDVKVAADGKAGWEMARKIIPDIIITDVMMPVMDGVELCRRLKSDVCTCHIPVIMLTAKDSEQDREAGYGVGADSYLTKPFSISLLHSRICNLLHARNMLAHSNAPADNDATVEVRKPEPADADNMVEMSAMDKEFIEKMRVSITEHLTSENVDIAFLSDCMCMSRATLYRKVKALTGLSPNEYIRKVRMQVACKLLIEGKLTVSEISFKVGISSTPYFRQCFKDEFGITPSDYVKAHKGE